jgi:hypothetical protein
MQWHFRDVTQPAETTPATVRAVAMNAEVVHTDVHACHVVSLSCKLMQLCHDGDFCK